MKPKSNLPRRRAMRLRGYDYSQPGAYFVTICVQHRKCIFGTIIDGKMHLNEIGEIVVEYWNRIPQHFSSVEIGEYVIMPNHIHGIIAWDIAETRSPNPQENARNRRGEVTSPSLGKIAEARSPQPQENARKRRGEITSPSLGKIAETRSPNPQENARKRRGEVTSPSLGKNAEARSPQPQENARKRRARGHLPLIRQKRRGEITSTTRKRKKA